MIYLLTNFWLWLLLALFIGVGVGWITYRGRSPNMLRELWPWTVLFLVGAAVVFLRLLPDRFGLWAELGLMLSASYFIGCFASYLLRSGQGSEAVVTAGAVSGTKLATTIVSAKSAVAEIAVEPAKEAAAKAEEPAREEAITGLSGPRNGKKDDLTKVYGIDAEAEATLNGLGIYHFDQIAAMTPGQSRWLFSQFGHSGRFPSWWWRWKYDADQLASGKMPDTVGMPTGPMVGLMETAGGDQHQQGDAVSGSADDAAPAVTGKPVSEGKKAAAPAAGNLDADAYEGQKPVGLVSARDGKTDDLKRISGIGKQNEGRLHALGIWHFDQIAAWSDEEIKWVGSYLAFSGRIAREDWKGQAAILAKGGVTDFAARADKGEVATSRDDTNDDGKNNIAKLDKPVIKPAKA